MRTRPFSCLRLIVLISLISTGWTFGQSTIKIMPLGNSMTEGWMDGTEIDAQRKAYRYDLKLLLENTGGYSIDFVGSKSTGSFYFTDCQNAGISGTRDQYLERMLIDGFDERWGIQETTGPYLDAFNPDVILLSIGTNDLTHEANAITNQRVSAILDQIDLYETRAGKEVMVFLALIINRRLLSNGNEPLNFYSTHQWNLAIKAMAQQRITNGDKIVIVNMEEEAGINYAYNGGDMCITDPEGLHPSAAGYAKMAALWYQKFMANFNLAPAIAAIPNQSIAEGSNFAPVQLDNYVNDVEDADQYITWTYTQLSTSNLNITINASRQAVITPKDANWSGSQTVVFTATDRGKSGVNVKSDKDTVVFSISAVNDPPTITGQSLLSVNEDNSLALTLSNFTITDPDSDPSTYQLVVLSGSNYTVTGNTVKPVANFSGNLNVNVAVRDNIEQGQVFSAAITVNAINDPPVYSGQPDIAIDEDNTYVVDLQNFMVSDPDNTLSQLTLVMLPGLNYAIEGAVIRPSSNYNGTIYVESYIQDSQGAVSSTFYIQITINAVNDPPVFTSESIDTINLNSQYTYSIKVNDPDGDQLTFTVPIKPNWITFYPNSKLLAGVPQDGVPLNNSVSISVNDGHVSVYQSYILYVKGGLSAISDIESSLLKLYPNPASSFVYIDREDINEEFTFRLYDMDGRLVLTKIICASCDPAVYFDENKLHPGTYIYSIQSLKGLVNGKLAIQE